MTSFWPATHLQHRFESLQRRSSAAYARCTDSAKPIAGAGNLTGGMCERAPMFETAGHPEQRELVHAQAGLWDS